MRDGGFNFLPFKVVPFDRMVMISY